MQSQLKAVRVESKGKTPAKVATAVDELQFLLDFNSSVCQAMAKSIEHLTEFVFVHMANATLLRRDSYLSYLKAGVKADTLNALRTAPLQLDTLFPDSAVKRAEEDISGFDKGRSASVYKSRRYHPYERQEPRSDKGQDRSAWKNLSRTQRRKNKGKQQYSSCVSFLPLRLLAGSSPQEIMNTPSVLKLNVVHPVPFAPGHSQKNEISPGAADCQSKQSKLKFVKGVSCVIPLSCANPVINAPNVATNLPVGARLQNFWQTWLDLGAGPKAVQILKEGYTLPFRTRPNLSRNSTVISNYGNPHRNLSLLDALHQLLEKNAIELVHKPNSLGFFNRLFLVPKPNNKWRPILDLSNLNPFLKVERFKMETPETIRTSLQRGEWVTSIDFKDAYFHIPIQEQSRKYLRFHVKGQTYQFKALLFGLSTAPLEFTVIAKEVKLMAIHKGIRIHQYVDDWLVRATSHRVCLQQTSTSRNVPETGMASELRKVGVGAQAGFQLCRLPVRPSVRLGPTYTGPVAKPSRQNTGASKSTGLSGPRVHVIDRPVNSHRKTGSSRPTTYETHSVASQKQLESTGISGEVNSTTQVIAPTLALVASRK